MNKLAIQLNSYILSTNPNIFDMLSRIGKELFFPKGILSQTEEAKKIATKFNATIGIAKENNIPMFLNKIISDINIKNPEKTITYASSFGLLELRKLWKKLLFDKNPSLKNKNISLPVVTVGITHAICIFADMWINENDTIIIPNMFWGNYNMLFNVRKNAKISKFELFSKDGGFNLLKFEETIFLESKNNKKIILVFNFPHNPTGYSLNYNEAIEIVKIIKKVASFGVNIIALCDDAYFGLVYDSNNLKESLFGMLCDCHKNVLAVKVDGATKEEFAWGLRVGFITYGCAGIGDKNTLLYDSLEKKAAGCVRGTVSNVSHLSQRLILRNLRSNESFKEKREKFELLKYRFQILKQIVNNKKYCNVWSVYPFNSGYFMCLKLITVDANDLRKYLLKKYAIGVISINSKNIRIAFSCVESNSFENLFENIFFAIKELEIRHKNDVFKE